MNITDLAWAAGIVDGEGCFSVRKNKPGSGGNRTISPSYALFLKVTMAHEPTIKRLHKMFGGSIYFHARVKSHWKNTHSWIVQSRQAEPVIEQLLPYLFTKREEAKLALKLLALPQRPGSVPVSPKVLAQRELIYQKMKGLKHE